MSPSVSLVLAAVLAVVLVRELSDVPASTAPASIPQPAPPAGRAAAVAALADQTPSWAQTALARPLFSVDRRPPRRVAGRTATVAPGGPVLPRLAGIIIDPTGGVAIFAPGADGEKPQAVPKGGKLRAWTVVDIAPREVRVSGPDGEATLHVAFDLAPRAAEAASLATGPNGLSPPMRSRAINLHPTQQRQGGLTE